MHHGGNMEGLFLKSEADLSRNEDRQLLPEEEYLARIDSFDFKKDEPDQYSETGKRSYFIFKLKPVSFADGSELEDVDGNPVEDDKLLFAFIDPARTGFGPAGPSRARKFFAAALGVQPTGEIRVQKMEELLGREVIASVTMSKDGKNNKVIDFRKTKVNRRSRAEAPTPAVEDDNVADATSVNDEDTF
jgi:hypothetical protein